jgi:hypothetical protein
VENVFDVSLKEENFKWLYEMILKLKSVSSAYIQEYKQN